MSEQLKQSTDVVSLDVPLNLDGFLRSLVRELVGTLEEVVGLEQASGFVSVVGQTMGERLDKEYRTALGVSSLTREQLTHVLIDLKRRIQGDFYLVELSDDKIVLGNRACPFAKMVADRKSMCMMTSNIFGSITAENLGYAGVELQKTIAAGDPECRVVVHLKEDVVPQVGEAREYFRSQPHDTG